jgi:hypothetical protein
MCDPDYGMPDGLSLAGQQAYATIIIFLTERDLLHSGGQKQVFWSPAQWAQRQEDFGRGAELIILHDGGEHAGAFNLDYERYQLHDELTVRLDAHGLWCEQQTSWYSAIYTKEKGIQHG